jgi:hypothetical protein
MDKDYSLFMSLDEAKEKKIYVADDFFLDIAGKGDVTYRHGRIFRCLSCAKLQLQSIVC